MSEHERVPYEDLRDTLLKATRNLGLPEDRAERCAALFAETTRDGVYSHGIRRFPRFVEQVEARVIDVKAMPVRTHSYGALERWDGQAGPGNVAAWDAMDRAMALAKAHGIGAVALSNTNHWMRGGSYGWQAAEAGFVGICWTNTMPNVPPWGGRDPRLGNNPLVVGVPWKEGPVVLDMAVSQFSYGALVSHAQTDRALTVPGGYDAEGSLSTDAEAILETGRVLPVGYWKGSGLALVLDLVAALLSGGRSTCEIETEPVRGETGLSQIFIAAEVESPGGAQAADDLVARAISFMKSSAPSDDNGAIRFPGEGSLQKRRENLEQGVPVEPEPWALIRKLAAG